MLLMEIIENVIWFIVGAEESPERQRNKLAHGLQGQPTARPVQKPSNGVHSQAFEFVRASSGGYLSVTVPDE